MDTCHVSFFQRLGISTTASTGMPAPELFSFSFPGSYYLQHYGKSLLSKVLQVGPVPSHVAFVMDGNRRFAKRHHQETREGHNAGFESLSQILELCYNTGIQVVTIFAFSIENFNRTPYEVNSLMEIMKSKLLQIIERGYATVFYLCQDPTLVNLLLEIYAMSTVFPLKYLETESC